MTPLQRSACFAARRATANFYSHRSRHAQRFGFRAGLGKGCEKCDRTSAKVILATAAALAVTHA